MFTTRDKEKDNHSTVNCAERHTGAFWYDACLIANPTGLYYNGKFNIILYITTFQLNLLPYLFKSSQLGQKYRVQASNCTTYILVSTSIWLYT